MSSLRLVLCAHVDSRLVFYPRRWGISEALRVNLGDGITVLIRVEMSGGLPWANGDWLTFFGRETPFVFSEQPALPAGASLINLNDNWQVDRKPLLRGSAGDSFSVFQSRSPSTAPIPYRSVIAAGKTVAPDLVDGSNVTFPVVLSEPMPTSIGVRLDVPAATQALRESRPATPVAAAGFVITYRRGLHRIGVVSRGNNGLEAGMQVPSRHSARVSGASAMGRRFPA